MLIQVDDAVKVMDSKVPGAAYGYQSQQYGQPVNPSQYGNQPQQYGDSSRRYGNDNGNYSSYGNSSYYNANSPYGSYQYDSQAGAPSQYGSQYGSLYSGSSQYGAPSSQYGMPYGASNSSQYGMPYGAASSSQYGSQMRYDGQDQKQAGASQHSDSRMAEQIQNDLRRDNKFSNISVSANEGYVTLKGTVANQNDKNALEQRIRGMQGVQNVNNQVTVKNS